MQLLFFSYFYQEFNKRYIKTEETKYITICIALSGATVIYKMYKSMNL